ncbi:MAG: hypothetical protein H6Q82_1038 [Deltaproteobacteria bacterium]|nr:hypothetical protein [Deltaproteobacteria bacterium]
MEFPPENPCPADRGAKVGGEGDRRISSLPVFPYPAHPPCRRLGGWCREQKEMYPERQGKFNDGHGRSATVVQCMSTGLADSRLFRSIDTRMYGLTIVLLPRAEQGKTHSIDERIPIDEIEETTQIGCGRVKV